MGLNPLGRGCSDVVVGARRVDGSDWGSITTLWRLLTSIFWERFEALYKKGLSKREEVEECNKGGTLDNQPAAMRGTRRRSFVETRAQGRPAAPRERPPGGHRHHVSQLVLVVVNINIVAIGIIVITIRHRRR